MVAPSFLAILSSICCACAAEKPPEKREPKVRKSSFLGLVKGALKVAMNCVSSTSCRGSPWALKNRPLPALASCSLGSGVMPVATSSAYSGSAASSSLMTTSTPCALSCSTVWL
jgi:hypothetical protein